jgi:epidermal growth factor receptor substrate 15
VWDLSDQDNDSMLSLREFCYAVYLMERYREGRPPPQSLPSSVIFDETLMSMTGHPNIAYGNAAWSVGPGIFTNLYYLFFSLLLDISSLIFYSFLSQGFQQQQGRPGAPPVAPAAGLRPPVQGTPAQADGTVAPDQKKFGTSALDDSFLNDTDNSEQNIETAGKKVYALPCSFCPYVTQF